MPDRFDIVVAGAGHNSLIAAAYLAKAGFRCLVLEGRPVVGGNCVTEELTLPGGRSPAGPPTACRSRACTRPAPPPILAARSRPAGPQRRRRDLKDLGTSLEAAIARQDGALAPAK
jgi:choline dehydrogenase-like flavoprotein